MRVNTYDLMMWDGMPTLSKVKSNNYDCNGDFRTPDIVEEFCKGFLDLHHKAEEYVYLFSLNTKNKLLGISEVSHGVVNSTILRSREIYIRALLMGASNIILVHNHPSGDTAPSSCDNNATKHIREIGDLVDIPLLDHIIVGDGYYSYAEHWN